MGVNEGIIKIKEKTNSAVVRGKRNERPWAK
jgi:hypothetical protein